MTALRLVAASSLLVLAACPGPAAGPAEEPLPPSAFTLEAAGTGAPNDAPLWPVAEGQRFDAFEVLPPQRLGGRTVFPFAQASQYVWEQPPPQQQQVVQLFAPSADGALLLLGDTRSGVFAEPAVWLPARVRVGMRWSTGPAVLGEPRFVIRVQGEALRPSVAGTRRTWWLQVFDRAAYNADQRNTGLVRGSTQDWLYAEGVGPVRFPLGWVSHLVAPAPTASAPAPAEPALGLSPLNGGQPVADGFLPQYVFSVEGAAQPEGLGVVGVSSALAASNLTGGVMATAGLGAACLRFDGSGAVGEGTCLNALGAVPLEDGGTARIPSAGFSVDRALSCERESRPGCWSFTFDAVWAAGDGGVEVLASEASYLATWDPAPFNPSHGVASGIVSLGRVLAPLGAEPGLALLFTGHAAEGRAFGAPAGTALDWLGLEGARSLPRSGPVVAHHALGIRSTEAGRDTLATTPFGRVDELLITRTGLAWRHLGDVALPPGHTLQAAIRRGDEVLAFTNEGFRGADPQYQRDGRDFAIQPDFGRAYAWRVTGLGAPGPARTPSPMQSLRHFVSGRDLVLCWHGGDGARPEGAWTLSGEPATVLYAEGSRCAVVVRKADSRVGDDAPDRFVASGRLGGQAFVTGVSPGAARTLEGAGVLLDAPAGVASGVGLASGGRVGRFGVYAPGLVPLRLLPEALQCETRQSRFDGELAACQGTAFTLDAEWALAPPSDARGRAVGGGELTSSVVRWVDGGTSPLVVPTGAQPEALLGNGVLLSSTDDGGTWLATRDGAPLWSASLVAPHGSSQSVWDLGRLTAPDGGLTRVDSLTGVMTSFPASGLFTADPWPTPAVHALRPPGGKALHLVVVEDHGWEYEATTWVLGDGPPRRVDAAPLQVLRGDEALLVDGQAITAVHLNPDAPEAWLPIRRVPLAAP